MQNILIPTKLNAAAKQLLEEQGYTVVQDADASMDELIKQHPDTEALIVRSNKVTPEVLDALPKLRLVVRAGAGYNTIDVKHARKNGVDVMNTPGANSNAVAEEVITLVLSHFRHVLRGDASVREGLWEKKKLMGRELSGKTIGILGLGNIGQFLIKRLRGFDCRIVGFDPLISAARAEELGVDSIEGTKEELRSFLLEQEKQKARRNARESEAAIKAAEAFVAPHLEFDVKI